MPYAAQASIQVVGDSIRRSGTLVERNSTAGVRPVSRRRLRQNSVRASISSRLKNRHASQKQISRLVEKNRLKSPWMALTSPRTK